MRVAGEHLVAQREAIKGNHQGDAHLFAIGAVIARVAAFGLRIGGSLAFEVGRGDIVEQHFVVQGEELAHALGQVRLERGFVRQQFVEPTIQPILVDERIVQLQQIAQRGAPVPVLGNMQFAGGLTQPGGHQHGGHLLPRHFFLAGRDVGCSELIEPAGAPQRERQVHIAEVPAVFHAHPFETHAYGLVARAVVEQIRLLGFANERARQRACAQASRFIELAQVRDRLLYHATADAYRAHQPPGAMDLAVLLSRRVAQVHRCASERTPTQLPRGKVGTTRRFAPHAECKSMIPFRPASRKT